MPILYAIGRAAKSCAKVNLVSISCCRQKAYHVYAFSDFQTARLQLIEAALADPDHPRIPADLARLFMTEGEYQAAQDLLKALTTTLRSHPEITRLLIPLDFILTAQAASPAVAVIFVTT